MRRKITGETWEQIKVAFVSGIGLREIARKINIPEGTVLAHAKRHDWTQQIQAATGQLAVMQSDAIAPVQSVPQSLAEILGERRERTKLGLSKYVTEAAERAAESGGDLALSRNVRNIADVHSILWPMEQNQNKPILNLALLIGAQKPERIEKIEPKALPDTE